MSSGGIAAFNAAWYLPDVFSRVLSWVGSFTASQWKEDPAVPDGGQDYPEKILREPKRNIRVWLQDGSHDMVGTDGELWWGSQPLSNIRMAQSLKMKDYDFHFTYGEGRHDVAQGAAEIPESMIWLWRGYDPNKTEEKFQMDAEEKAKPFFVVKLADR
jgi:enterochelin esterase family protein